MRTIAELLKDKPKGLKLYTPIFGDVCFEGISETEGDIIIVSDCNGVRQRFYADGTYSNIGECLLFPSKESRDWESFTGESSKIGNTEDLQDLVQQLNKRCDEAILIGMAYSKYVAITLFRDVPVSVKEKMLHDFLECQSIKEIRVVYDNYNHLTLNGESGDNL